MKIAVVSTGRSRCSLLGHYLHTLHNDLELLGEFYTEAHWNGKHDLIELTQELFEKENYIVKIMSLHSVEEMIFGPEVFKFEEYDEIHLIERRDFFEQCCSWQVANDTKIYHHTEITQDKINSISKSTYHVSHQQIYQNTHKIARYLDIKRYLINNNIPYTLHTYEGAKAYSDKQSVLKDSNLNYGELIVNYDLKDKINKLFNQYFSYENATSDLESFKRDLLDYNNVRLRVFANKISTAPNKQY